VAKITQLHVEESVGSGEWMHLCQAGRVVVKVYLLVPHFTGGKKRHSEWDKDLLKIT
jgi:hypothetical protein